MDQAQTGRPENGAVTPKPDPHCLFAFVDRDGDRLEVRVGEEPGGSICTHNRENDEWTGAHLPSALMNVQGLLDAILEATGMALRVDLGTGQVTVVRR